MIALLLLPILVSGFIVANSHMYYFYRLHRYEGQYLYLKSAQLGMFCLFLSIIELLSLQWCLNYVLQICLTTEVDFIGALSEKINEFIGENQNSEHVSFFLLLSALSILTAYIWSHLYNNKMNKPGSGGQLRSVDLIYDLLNDSPIDRLFFESYRNLWPILISLNNNKIYVGIIGELGEPNEAEGMDQEISLIPLASGCRDVDHRVVFTTNYQIMGTELDDLSIIIRQDQIISASHFDFDVYEKLNADMLNSDKDKD